MSLQNSGLQLKNNKTINFKKLNINKILTNVTSAGVKTHAGLEKIESQLNIPDDLLNTTCQKIVFFHLTYFN